MQKIMVTCIKVKNKQNILLEKLVYYPPHRRNLVNLLAYNVIYQVKRIDKLKDLSSAYILTLIKLAQKAHR